MLRRHYVGHVLGEILATMPARPTDSVLRRHFDASVADRLASRVGADAAALLCPGLSAPSAAAAASVSASPVPPSRAAAAARPAAAQPAAAPAAAKGGGGLFGWLKRLFGG